MIRKPESGSSNQTQPEVSGDRKTRHIIVGMSGASGAIYGVRLVEALLAQADLEVHLIVTPAAVRVMNDELRLVSAPKIASGEDQPSSTGGGGAPAWLKYFDLDQRAQGEEASSSSAERLQLYPHADIGARPASGTFRNIGMIVVPCSMNTLASVAHGLQPNLLTRAAAVTLKEGRPLVLVPRETPVSLIDLRNMTSAAEAGAAVLPASPGFYAAPETIEDLVQFIVDRILDRIGLARPGAIRWTGSAPGAEAPRRG